MTIRFQKTARRLAGFLIPFTLAGCSLNPKLAPAPDDGRLARIAQAPTALEKDRLAILAMQGEYAVSFDFQETVVLKPGYEKRKSKTAGARETVVLVEDTGKKIVLQHLLVSGRGGRVIKHWRQDWTYQAPARFEFTEDQTWRIRPIAADVTKQAWTQCVHEVSDAPRYCGTGKWNHRYGVATWTSDRTWRPLPRREHTTRSDYNVLNAENRHTITPGGWTHEQDNTKTNRDGERTTGTLVREVGFNDYRRITGFDFNPAYIYWSATQEYWARVREEWEARFNAGNGLRLKTKVDGMPVIEALFEQAATVQKGGDVSDDALRAVFAQWVDAPGAGTTVTRPSAPSHASTY